MQEPLNQTYKMGPSPAELTPADIGILVSASSKEDWLYSEEEDVYSYRKNLLISMKQADEDGLRSVYYGYQEVAIATFR